MFSYGKDTILQNTIFTDYESIGTVSMEDLNNTPFYAFKYKGKTLKVKDEKKCGATGDCHEFLDSFLDIYFL